MITRKYKSTDYSTIEKIYNAAKPDELQFESRQVDLIPFALDGKRRDELLSSDIVICDAGEACGFGAIKGDKITGLFVLPKYRRRGAATLILSQLIKERAKDISLWVTKRNLPAQQLYQHSGFHYQSELIVVYNHVPIDVVEMSLSR